MIAKLKLHILPMVHATSNLVWGVLVTFVIIVTFVIFVTFVIIVRDPLKKVTNFRALPKIMIIIAITIIIIGWVHGNMGI